ncbi:Nn.00g062260.m01.CDS01 [Neocucurbitaria sp. VM-36]
MRLSIFLAPLFALVLSAEAATISTKASPPSSITKPSPTYTPLPRGVNVLKSPGFENITHSGRGGEMADWFTTTSRVYPVKYQPSAHGGTTYAVLTPLVASKIITDLSQNITALDTTRPYILTFYYDVFEIEDAHCTFSIFLNDVVIYIKFFTHVDEAREANWTGPIKTIPVKPKSPNQTLKFTYGCTQTGTGDPLDPISAIFLDDLSLVSI